MDRYLWYFYLYGFVGWCAEVVFAALKNGRFVNRGFLNGPICPIYGCGLVAVLAVLEPLSGNLPMLYLGSVALTTGMEWITGFLMEKLFHQRWWDYSKMPLNLGGYVCLLFSLLWGVACVIIVRGVHPHIAAFVGSIPADWSLALLVLFSAVFITDLTVTLATIARLDRKLKQIDELAATLRLASDRLGETMADGALALKAKDEQTCEDLVLARERARRALAEADERAHAEWEARYAVLVERLDLGQRRLLSAFPALRSLRHPSALRMLQGELARRKQRKSKTK